MSLFAAKVVVDAKLSRNKADWSSLALTNDVLGRELVPGAS